VLCTLLQHCKWALILVAPYAGEGSAIIILTSCEQIIHRISTSSTSSADHQTHQ